MNLRAFSAGWIILTLVTLGVTAGPVSAQERFRLIPGAGFLLGMESSFFWLSGEMLVPAGGQPGSGSKVDLPSDLGVDRSEAFGSTLQGTIFHNHLFNLDLLSAGPSGLKKAPRKFVFHNRTYLPGTLIATKLNLDWVRFCYAYMAADAGSWWLAPRVGLHYVRCSTTLNGETEEEGMISNNRTLDATYPVLGFEARYLLPFGVDVGVEWEGMHLITRGYLSLTRATAHWEVHPDVVLFVGVSNRLAGWTEENQKLNNEWFYSLSGWSAGISFAF
ncbi:MAG: hypothetical protein HY914_12625 [Desulfomonile tiedjei]|nr:hypothetical protein [Desulfomonile tiedjei]